MSCSQPDHYIDNVFIFNICPVTWYDYGILTSLVFRRKITSFGRLRHNIFFRSLSHSYLYLICSFSHISFPLFHFSTFYSFALSLSYNCLLQYLYNIPFHLSVHSLHPPVTKLHTHKFKTLLVLHHAASNMLKCNCVLNPKL